MVCLGIDRKEIYYYYYIIIIILHLAFYLALFEGVCSSLFKEEILG